MYKKNRNSLIHERLNNEAKLDVTIRRARTVLRFCRLFPQVEPNKCNIAWLRFSTFYYQSYRSKESDTVIRIRTQGNAMLALNPWSAGICKLKTTI